MTDAVEQPELIVNGICETSLDSWRAFIQFIEKSAPDDSLIYRGQADAQWKINSTLDRLEARFPKKPTPAGSNRDFFDCPPTTREVHLEAFKEVVRGKRGVNPRDLSPIEWWALAQHHGLATPLLDWTYSPFVALFFAFEEARCVGKDGASYEPGKRAVYVVPFHWIRDKGTPEHPAPELFSPRREITHRLSSQSG
ncbi:MAG: FRG domain-containing protein, partial [Thermoguttaceae bacterium]